jgi:ESCRT-I complex subunit VPS28
VPDSPMSSQRRPDVYGGGGGHGGPRYLPAAPHPGTVPPHYARPSPLDREQQEREAKRARDLEGVPKRGEREDAAARRTAEGVVRLSPEEKRLDEERGQIFSLIYMADGLERLWMDNTILDEDYEKACRKLIQQFGVARKAYETSVPDIAQFGAEFRCNAAHGLQFGYTRLMSGVPATMEHGLPSSEDRKRQSQRVHECTEAFISLMDNLELGHTTAEQLQPLARELRMTLGRVEGLETGFPFKAQIQAWLEKLCGMSALAALSPEDLADFKMQLTAGYQEYSDAL